MSRMLVSQLPVTSPRRGKGSGYQQNDAKGYFITNQQQWICNHNEDGVNCHHLSPYPVITNDHFQKSYLNLWAFPLLYWDHWLVCMIKKKTAFLHDWYMDVMNQGDIIFCNRSHWCSLDYSLNIKCKQPNIVTPISVPFRDTTHTIKGSVSIRPLQLWWFYAPQKSHKIEFGASKWVTAFRDFN